MDLPGRAPAESQELYRHGWEPVIDLRWIVTLAGPAWPGVEFSLMSHDESASVPPAVPVEVDDVDARVRRFLGPDPDGDVVNVLSQR